MAVNRIFVFVFVVMLTALPVYAGGTTLNRWVLNITINEDGIVDELVQIEIANAGSFPIDGFSFVVPSSQVTIIYDFDHTYSSKGIAVEQVSVQNGTKLNVKFDSPLNSGETWDGRIGFKAENFAKRPLNNYTIDVPLHGPQAVVSGKISDMKISPDVDLRSQIFLPKGVEVISVVPAPFRILFQNSLMVPTWTSMNIHFGDTIDLKGSFSDILKKIADVDERSKNLSKRIKDASAKGIDVGDVQMHLKNAEDYNTNGANSALSSFWKKDEKSATEYVGYAEKELDLADNSFSSSVDINAKPTETAIVLPEKSPAPGAANLILVIMSIFAVLRAMRHKQ